MKTKIEKTELREIPVVPVPKKFETVVSSVEIEGPDALQEIVRLFKDPNVTSFTFTKIKDKVGVEVPIHIEVEISTD